MKRLSWFVFFLIFSASCLDDPDCYQLHNQILGVTFRVMGSGAADSVMLDINGKDVPGVSYSYLLDYFKEEGEIGFVQPKTTNFLAFGYTVKNQFISEDCGSAFVLSDLRIQEHDFDSARVINPTPSKNGGTNIEIFRCPETDTLMINFNQLYATSDGETITNKRSTFISHNFTSITSDAAVGPVFSGQAATVKLPVDLTKNETSYVFNTANGQENLVIGYNLRTEQRYRPCGVQTFVIDLSVKSHSFDSLSFGLNADEEPVKTLQDPQIANLRIFDCPKIDQIRVGFKSGTTAKTVTIKSVTADHHTSNYLTSPRTTNSIDLPVDLESNTSTFYIQYTDDTIDTLRLQYTRTELTLFKACPNPVINELREVTDLPEINIIQPVLQYPLVTNVEISVD
jgi:hypothetical protein